MKVPFNSNMLYKQLLLIYCPEIIMRILHFFVLLAFLLVGCSNNTNQSNKNKFGPPSNIGGNQTANKNPKAQNTNKKKQPTTSNTNKTIPIQTKANLAPTKNASTQQNLGTQTNQTKTQEPLIQDEDLNTLQNQLHTARKDLEKELSK